MKCDYMKNIKSLDVCVGSALLFFYCSQFFISAQNQFFLVYFKLNSFFLSGKITKTIIKLN